MVNSMQALPEGITAERLERWADQGDHDPHNWHLKPGAPQEMIDAWPEFIEVMTTEEGPHPKDFIGPETRPQRRPDDNTH
jgi:hypothetical protein